MAWMVKKDDLVEVLSGKEKGKRGKVLRIVKGKDRVMVEKLIAPPGPDELCAFEFLEAPGSGMRGWVTSS